MHTTSLIYGSKRSPSQRPDCGEHGGCGLKLPLFASEAKQSVFSDSRAGDKANPLGVHKINKI